MAVWSAMPEPRATHLPIVEELLGAGAQCAVIGRPTGHVEIDALLDRACSR
jgi:hypothetical protein